MTPRISLLIASLHVLLYLVLTVRVVLHRNVHKIGIGTGGDEVLSRKVRVHANFVEYVPLGLSVAQTVFDGGAIAARVDEARAARDARAAI